MNRIDQPIVDEAQDRFARGAFVDGIARRLVRDNRASGIAIGLVGPWGSGKSSVLNLLEERLKADEALVIRFDPWLVSGRDDLIASFFAELAIGLRKRVGKFDVYNNGRDQATDAAIQAIEKYGEAISPLFRMLLPGGDVMAKVARAMVSNNEKHRSSLQSQREGIRRSLHEFDFPIVILIDELDRLEDAEVRVMAQLVRSIGDFAGVSYVIAYDEDRVVEALGGGGGDGAGKRGRAYLEKIVQLSLNLPFIRPLDLKDLVRQEVEQMVEAAGLTLTRGQAGRLGAILDIVVPSAIATGRDLRKAVADCAGRLVGLEDEIDPVDCFGYSVLLLKSEAIRQRIVEGLSSRDGRLTLREYFHAAHARVDGVGSLPYPVQRYSPAQTTWDEKLFGLLWPQCTATPVWRDLVPNRILFRRPLLTLAMHGVPRDTPAAMEVDAFAAAGAARFEDVNFEQVMQRFHRIEERCAVIEPGTIRQLWRDTAEWMERRAKEGGLTSAEALNIASSINRMATALTGSKVVDLAAETARMLNADMLLLPMGLLLLDSERSVVNTWRFGLAGSSLAPKVVDQLRALLARRTSAKFAVEPPPALYLQALLRDSQGKAMVALDLHDDPLLADMLELLFSGGRAPDAKELDSLFTRAELLEALRQSKLSRVASNNNRTEQALERARTYVDFFRPARSSKPRKPRTGKLA